MGNQITFSPWNHESLDNLLKSKEIEFKNQLLAFIKNGALGDELKQLENLIVVKIFNLNKNEFPKSQVERHLNALKELNQQVYQNYSTYTNCLPFQRVLATDNCVVLVRQFIKYNLKERLNTRPYLTMIEKRWIAFQLLNALNQIHSLGIVHGDVKIENVLLNSFMWVSLADFAPYKPVYLTKNHCSGDFRYNFDVSGCQTCCLAPERLEKPDCQSNELDAAMDIFSLGCVLAELFMEKPLFNLADLISYRAGKYDPSEELSSKIDDPDMVQMILKMVNIDPKERGSIQQHLLEQSCHAFPIYFVPLRNFLGQFACFPVGADEAIIKLKLNLPILMSNVNEIDNLILLSLILSFCRKIKSNENILTAIEMIQSLSKPLDDSIILDRLLPYYLDLLEPPTSSIVKLAAIFGIDNSLKRITKLDVRYMNIFSELLFDTLERAAMDESFVVRYAVARNIASLAMTSLRYLDATHNYFDANFNDSEAVDFNNKCYSRNYEYYNERVASIVIKLIGLTNKAECDSVNSVRETLIRSDFGTLCEFFGRQKTSSFLLPYIITLMNDPNWTGRAALFDTIPILISYIGQGSVEAMKPILIQGLCDYDEFVIYRSLICLTQLAENRLIDKPTTLYLIETYISGFVCHPSLWIRHAAVGFISELFVRRNNGILNYADLVSKVAAYLNNFLSRSDIFRFERPELLFACLKPPNKPAVKPKPPKTPSMSSIRKRSSTQMSSIVLEKYERSQEFIQPESITTFGRALVHKNKPRSATTIRKEKFNDCEVDTYIDRHKLIHQENLDKHARTQQRPINVCNTSMSSNLIWVPDEWRPNGQPVLQLAAHNHPIDRLSRSPDFSHFSTLSIDEECVRIWCVDSLIGRQKLMRDSVFACSSAAVEDFKPACASFYQNNSLAIFNKDCSLHIIDLDSKNTQYRLSSFKNQFKAFNLRVKKPSSTVSMFYLDRRSCEKDPLGTGENYPIEMICVNESNPSWPITATNSNDYYRSSPVKGLLVVSMMSGDVNGIDLRCRSPAFRIHRDIKRGYVTAIMTDPWFTWLATGSSRGSIEVFDFRFMVPVKNLQHPSQVSVSRLTAHPRRNDGLVAAYQGNNEVRLWQMNDDQPELVVWGVSSVAPCCTNKKSPAYFSGLVAVASNDFNGLLCASSDRRMRFINLNKPGEDSIVFESPFESMSELKIPEKSMETSEGFKAFKSRFKYEMRNIEGVNVLHEVEISGQQTRIISPVFGNQSHLTYHQDAISDLIIGWDQNLDRKQPVLISATRKGVFHVWR